jgi:hypothetical protein
VEATAVDHDVLVVVSGGSATTRTTGALGVDFDRAPSALISSASARRRCSITARFRDDALLRVVAVRVHGWAAIVAQRTKKTRSEIANT